MPAKKVTLRKHKLGVVRVYDNVEATAFDERYKDYDPMTLVVGTRKDVLASLRSVSVTLVNGQVVHTVSLPGDEMVLSGDITNGDEFQIDVFHKNDFRIVFWKQA